MVSTASHRARVRALKVVAREWPKCSAAWMGRGKRVANTLVLFTALPGRACSVLHDPCRTCCTGTMAQPSCCGVSLRRSSWRISFGLTDSESFCCDCWTPVSAEDNRVGAFGLIPSCHRCALCAPLAVTFGGNLSAMLRRSVTLVFPVRHRPGSKSHQPATVSMNLSIAVLSRATQSTYGRRRCHDQGAECSCRVGEKLTVRDDLCGEAAATAAGQVPGSPSLQWTLLTSLQRQAQERPNRGKGLAGAPPEIPTSLARGSRRGS